MASCTRCTHYEACKIWADHVDKIIESINVHIASQIGKEAFLDPLHFPFVAEDAKLLCPSYIKAEENV